MAVGETIEGTRVCLRPVLISDAEFTLEIRNDESLTAFIPKVEISLDDQRNWIERQRNKEGDYFYIFEDKNGRPRGTLSYYDVIGDTCELGRYISYGNAYENVEAVVLLLDYLFENGFRRIIFNNDERNEKIIRFWKKFNAEFVAKVPMNGWVAAQYVLTPELYAEKRKSIAKLIGSKE